MLIEELAQVRAMTIGELLDLMDDMPARATSEDWQAVEKPLGVILNHASDFHDKYDDRISEHALLLGLLATEGAYGIDKNTAAALVYIMGEVAYFMLSPLDREPEHETWSPETVARLKVIRDTNPDLADTDAASEAAE